MEFRNDPSSSDCGNLVAAGDDDIYSNAITFHSAAPKVGRNPTFESTTSAEETDGEIQLTTHRDTGISNSFEDRKNTNDLDHEDDDDIVEGSHRIDFRRSSTRVETLDCSLFSSWEDVMTHIFYISTFSILGTVSRLYVGRLFGLDCIRQEQNDDTHNDFLSPLLSHICITSDGKTQRGGAIFIDLPANMLGSYVSKFFLVPSTHEAFNTPIFFAFQRSTGSCSEFSAMKVVHLDGYLTIIHSRETKHYTWD
jgi:hypothetical protein